MFRIIITHYVIQSQFLELLYCFKLKDIKMKPQQNSQPSFIPASQQLMQINIKFGDNTNIDPIATLKLTFQMNKQDIGLKQSIKTKLNNGEEDDIFIEFRFKVNDGREKQATEYLQKAMNEPDEDIKQSFNLIQQMLGLLQRSQGAVQYEHKKGQVLAYYIIYNEESVAKFGQQFKELYAGFGPKLELNCFIKGQQSKNQQKQSSIEPIYSQIKIVLGSNVQEIFNMFYKLMKFRQEQKEKLTIFKLNRGLKKISMKFQFFIFQRILKMYREIAEKQYKISQKQQSQRTSRLLKKTIDATVSWKKVGLFKISVTFQKEDYLHIILYAIKDFLKR